MSEPPLTPVLAREPVVDRAAVLTPPWVRWLEQVRRVAAQAQALQALLTPFALTLLDDPDAAAMLETLGISAFVPAASTAVVTADSGASVLTASGLVPEGATLWCVLTRIDTTFSTENGLTALQVGDSVVQDGFGQVGLTAGLTTRPQDMRRGDHPWTPAGYTVLVRALGGTFGASGALTLKAVYSTAQAW